MQQVVRFTDPDEAAATLQVRDGDPTAVDFYLNHRRIIAGTADTIPDAAYTAWLADVRAGRDALLLAATGTDGDRAERPGPGRPGRWPAWSTSTGSRCGTAPPPGSGTGSRPAATTAG